MWPTRSGLSVDMTGIYIDQFVIVLFIVVVKRHVRKSWEKVMGKVMGKAHVESHGKRSCEKVMGKGHVESQVVL